MRYASKAIALLMALAACTGGEREQESIDLSADPGLVTHVFDLSGSPLGSVRLPSSCSEAADVHLGRGLALLHSMTYEDAEAAFAAAAEANPDSAMAYWGQAMTVVHPLWSDPPSEARFEAGRNLLEQARTKARSEQEIDYVEALTGYYQPGRGDSEKPNLAGFENGWRAFHEKYPLDPEGTAFYALAQLATVDPGDKTFAKQRKAGALAEGVLESIPDHPGGHHYVIHSYDNPVLSHMAVDVARSYGKIAPDIPHALHMPTHTFTRLGLWQESIDWNRRSGDAALKRPVGDKISLHYFHALDYLAYAYLQGAEDQRALNVLVELTGVNPPYQAHVASAYTFAAVPAFARALGGARSGRFEQARADLATLSELQGKVAAANAYWGTQVEIQRLSALAWLQFEEGSRDEALSTMRAAAELEAGTEKHPVTPGEVLPARELLADMLLQLERPTEALSEYEAALERSPNRFNSLYGAGRAAELSGDTEAARRYYGSLVEVAANADTDRERLQHAKDYVARG
jgi:tetratricopeptide (TPR) repeat protein